ncbi:hypothetical protein O6H91_13G007900 [Diphasiastrum complanatum]|nr:hypothetical protein O6H91_13G007900 [Diphasiastrum complanatum]
MWAVSLLQLLQTIAVLGCISKVPWIISSLRVGSSEYHPTSSFAQLSLKHSYHDLYCGQITQNLHRPHSVSITEFGAVGDGITPNTYAFQNAIFYLKSFADKGGAQLYVPRGRWLTGSFNLTSHLTLYLEEGAIILASQDPKQWPVIAPLPSYGRGREFSGGRHISLIHGINLTDVVITGKNGTIDGQGSVWWDWFHAKTLNHTRGHLVEFIHSQDIIVSNVTFMNSPFWTIHPVYCRNVVVHGVTILAPADSPNTDGIDPDSCSDVCIQDCYISTGDDLISIKSGWDEYGIAFAEPSFNIVIHRVVGETPTSAGIAFGSEMSGGIHTVHVDSLLIKNCRTGIRLKTAAGRGGFVVNISITGTVMHNVVTAFDFNALYGDHPDDHFDPGAYPVVTGILIANTVGENISHAGNFQGLAQAPFKNVCLKNVFLEGNVGGFEWNCSGIEGFSTNVSPPPCPELQILRDDSGCYSPVKGRSQVGGLQSESK